MSGYHATLIAILVVGIGGLLAEWLIPLLWRRWKARKVVQVDVPVEDDCCYRLEFWFLEEHWRLLVQSFDYVDARPVAERDFPEKGRFNMHRLVGPKGHVDAFCALFGDVMAPHKDFTIIDREGVRRVFRNAVITNVGASVAANDMRIMEYLDGLYTTSEPLEVEDARSPA